jgi:hypothetical protein
MEQFADIVGGNYKVLINDSLTRFLYINPIQLINCLLIDSKKKSGSFKSET